MNFRRQVLLSGLLVFAVGCQSSDTSSNESEEPSEPAKTETVTVASWDEVQQKIASHQGKVVVVDLWSTWCAPVHSRIPKSRQATRRTRGLGHLHVRQPQLRRDGRCATGIAS